ncbi:MAG: hypothetical protein P1Q69_10065 [Candidatus Thorarchaeota archaeon]|nr:hypothetical protein [Candidatus Thorarchaeota archaeon]
MLPGYVEVRDRGLIKKKIKVRNRSFDDVLDDLQVYFQFIGKRLPPGVLVDSLITIGVPRAKKIISEEVLTEEKVKEPVVTSKPELIHEIDSVPDAVEDEEEDESQSIPLITTKKSLDVKAGQVTVIDDQDLPDIEDALTAVESISDTFMAPSPESQVDEVSSTKPLIRISLTGSSEVKASNASTATDPNLVSSSDGIESVEVVSEPLDEIEKEHEAESIETLDDLFIETHETHQEHLEKDVEEITEIRDEVDGSITLEEAMKPKDKTTPSHAVRPLVSTKVVILGEDGVGKHSLQNKGGLKIQDGPEIDGEPREYIRSGIFRLEDYRVDVNVWSFDDAVNMKVSRREFYDETDTIIIVYSVADRWSFESIDFWLKESTVKAARTPPIIIVGNKKDIRDSGEPDPLEPPVSSEEGFKLAESLAKKMGEGGKLHPVAFIETSCLTGEGTEDVFRTAGEFYTNTL